MAIVKYVYRYTNDSLNHEILEINKDFDEMKANKEIFGGGRFINHSEFGGYTNGILPNGHPFSTFDYDLFSNLSKDNQEKANVWVTEYCKPIKSYNTRHSSYGLKHDLEHVTGVYMTNNQFKDLMLQHNFKPANIHDLNWIFCISEKWLKLSRSK